MQRQRSFSPGESLVSPGHNRPVTCSTKHSFKGPLYYDTRRMAYTRNSTIRNHHKQVSFAFIYVALNNSEIDSRPLSTAMKH